MLKCKVCNIEVENLRKLGKHLAFHSLDRKEYFDKYELDPTDNLICNKLGCNNLRHFISFSKGYTKYCSLSCGSSVSMSNKHKDPEFVLIRNEALSKSISKFNSSEEGKSLRSERLSRSEIKSEYARNISVNKSTCECTLYLSEVDNPSYDLKFGITSHIKRRISTMKYSNTIELLSSDRVSISNIEYILSIKFKGEWIKNSDKECFNSLFNIIKLLIEEDNTFKHILRIKDFKEFKSKIGSYLLRIDSTLLI
jgi:hypothetical protein